jgi:hypothetical protein
MTPGDVTLVKWGALALIPGLVLIAGIVMWSRRRSS